MVQAKVFQVSKTEGGAGEKNGEVGEGVIGIFNHERLDAHRVSLQCVKFVAERRGALRGLPGNTGAQLERAIVGAHTNLCSAATHRGAEGHRQFRIALSEANEAAGASEIALAYGAISSAEHLQLRHMLLRLCAMLRGLSQ